MSFHVVLPSNSSTKLFSQNTLSSFCVRLAKPIQLNQAYEVALEEVICPRLSFDFLANEVEMKILTAGDANNETAPKLVKQIPIEFSSKIGLKTIFWCLNKHLAEFNWKLIFNMHGNFKFVCTSRKIEYFVLLHPKLAYSLGFVRQPFIKILRNHEEKSPFPSRLFLEHSQMFVYADIVEYQHVGDALAPLLRICMLGNADNAFSEKYIRPYYVPVAKNRIDEINIQVRTHTGSFFPFPDGAPLICKLHFRPKRQ